MSSLSSPKQQTRICSCESRNLKQIPRISANSNFEVIRASRNPITSLTGLPTLPKLSELYLDETFIDSFKDANPQPSLTHVSMVKSPVSFYDHYRIMTIIVFGDQLRFIDDQKVTIKELQIARELRSSVLKPLTDGLILSSLKPCHMINPKTKLRRTVHRSAEASPFSRSLTASQFSVRQQQSIPNLASFAKMPVIGCASTIFSPLNESLVDKRWNATLAKNYQFHIVVTFTASSFSISPFFTALEDEENPFPLVDLLLEEIENRFLDFYGVTRDFDCVIVPLTKIGNVVYESSGVTVTPEEIFHRVCDETNSVLMDLFKQKLHSVALRLPKFFSGEQRDTIMNTYTGESLARTRISVMPMAQVMSMAASKVCKADRKILVCSLRKRSLDMVVISLINGSMRVLQVCRSHAAGSFEMDKMCCEYFITQLNQKMRKAVMSSHELRMKLMAACKHVKEVISSSPTGSIRIPDFCDGIAFFSSISRDSYMQMCEQPLRNCVAEFQKLLTENHIENITDVVYSSKAGIFGPFRERVEPLFGDDVVHHVFHGRDVELLAPPDEASMFAVIDSLHEELIEEMDDRPKLPLTVKFAFDNKVFIFFRSGTVLPVSKTGFVTVTPTDGNVELGLLQGERKPIQENYLIKPIFLTGVKSQKLKVKLEISESMDMNIVIYEKSAVLQTLNITQRDWFVPSDDVSFIKANNKGEELAQFLMKIKYMNFCIRARAILQNMKSGQLSSDMKIVVSQAIKSAQMWLWKNQEESVAVYQQKLENVKGKLPPEFQ